MSYEELVREHRKVAHVARRWGEEALHVWYADLGLQVDGDQVSYHCPQCGVAQATTVHEFVYTETNDALRCYDCRGEVEERAGALD